MILNTLLKLADLTFPDFLDITFSCNLEKSLLKRPQLKLTLDFRVTIEAFSSSKMSHSFSLFNVLLDAENLSSFKL